MTPWPCKGLRRISVNSFGIGGTNAHVILDDACYYLQLNKLQVNHATVSHDWSSHSHANGHVQTLQYNPDGNHVNGIVNGYVNGDAQQIINDNVDSWLPSNGETGVLSNGSAQSRAGQLCKLLTFTAFSKKSLELLVGQYAKFFQQDMPLPEDFDTYLSQLAYTLNQRRSLFRFRSFAIIKNTTDLANIDKQISSVAQPFSDPALAFVFTGQGAQYVGMARELLHYPIFKLRLTKSANLLKSFGCPWSLLEEVFACSASRINSPEISQPALTAIQIALVDLLDSFQVKPKAMIGHSSGEIAAAYCHGSLSDYEAMFIAYQRGICAANLIALEKDSGSMLAVGLGEMDAREYINAVDISPAGLPLEVACVNSHKNVTLAGPTIYIDQIVDQLRKNNVFCRKLKTGVAYHTRHMEQVAISYELSLRKLGFEKQTQPRRALMISTVTGRPIDSNSLRSSDYWVKNLVSTVQFSKGLAELCNHSHQRVFKRLDGSHKKAFGANIVLEVGPHSALQGPIRDFLGTVPWGDDVKYMTTLRRGEDALHVTMETMGSLHNLGVTVDLGQLNDLSSAKTMDKVLVDLPPYPFDHSVSYWREGRISKRFRLDPHGKLDLLGRQVMDFNELEACWRNHLRLADMPWMEDHVVNGVVIYPAAGMLVMAIEAAHQMSDESRNIAGFSLEDVTFSRALTVPDNAIGIETRLLVRRVNEARSSYSSKQEFRLCSYENESWQENCRGYISIQYEAPLDEVRGEDFAFSECLRRHASIIESCKETFDRDQVYNRLYQSGLQFGDNFRLVESGNYSEDCQAYSSVKIWQWPAKQNPQPHVIHPTTLDGILHMSAIAHTNGGRVTRPLSVPTAIRSLWIAKNGLSEDHARSAIASSWADMLQSRRQEFCGYALDGPQSHVLVKYEGLQFTVIGENESKAQQNMESKQVMYGLTYHPSFNTLDPARLWKLCSQDMSAVKSPSEYIEDLNFVLFKFLWDVCHDLESEKTIELLPHLVRYRQWAQLQVDSFLKGELALSTPDWHNRLSNEYEFQQKCEEISKANDQVWALVRTGRALPKILNGKLDALEFLFGDDMMPRFYAQVNTDRIGFEQWERYLRAYAQDNPTMRILEIGAGTGGTSERVLKALQLSKDKSLYSSYDYTDISPAFFAQAEEKFGHHPRLCFKTLNIEESPIAQGFEASSYDVVIAANVLHATKNIAETLQNVHSLLKPNGKLMMYEATRPNIIRSNLLAGLMAGWWIGEEKSRYWSPLLTTPEWHNTLIANDFSGVELEFLDYEEPNCQEAAILISSRSIPDPLRSLHTPLVFVADPTSATQRHIIDDLSVVIKDQYTHVSIEVCTLADCTLRQDLGEITVLILYEIETLLLSDIQSHSFLELQHIIVGCNRILWLTAGGGVVGQMPEYRLVEGLFRTLHTEKTLRRTAFIALQVESLKTRLLSTQLSQILAVLRTLVENGVTEYDAEYVEVAGGEFCVPRIVEKADLTEELYDLGLRQLSRNMSLHHAGAVELKIATFGVLDSLHWIRDVGQEKLLGDTEIEIEVKALGLNFKDCLIALGRVHADALGQESAGVVARAGSASGYRAGDRVISFGSGTFKTFVRSTKEFVSKIPDGMSYFEAAAIPTQYGTAWETVVELGRLKRGESILIHAGAGGTGQAAIQLALMIGAEVFATVGSSFKKDLLIREYKIQEDHIFYSRNNSFAQGIQYMTKGRGVDVIINSLAGDALLATWSCIASYGRFVEIGKADILANSSLPMNMFHKNVSFMHFDGATWITETPARAKKTIENIFTLLQEGKISVQKPLEIYSIAKVEDAFRTMQSGSNAGKIVLDMDSGAQIPTLLEQKIDSFLNPDATYLIAGGLGGIGRTTARWMARRGAKNLVLLGRSGAKTTVAEELIDELRSQGVTVMAPPCDIVNVSEVREVIDTISKTMPPIKGCIQGSMVLRDGRFEEMSYSDWRIVAECKGLGSWNLHTHLPSDLDFFVMLSSLSGVIGLPGQANYASGNSYLDALARYRVTRGQRAISLDLGIMIDDGFLAESEGVLNRVKAYDTMSPITRQQYLTTLDYFCDARRPIPKPDDCQILIGLDCPAASNSYMANSFMSKPMSRFLALEAIEARSAIQHSGLAESTTDYRRLFSKAVSVAEACSAVTQAIISRLETVYHLTVPDSDVDTTTPMYKLGVDSLLAVELCNWIGKTFTAELAVFEILGRATLESIALLISTRSSLVHF